MQIGAFKIGLIHGHQIVPWGDAASLAIKQRSLDCDILISGHTHSSSVVERDDVWYINPGSITGAFSPASDGETAPAFVLLAIQGAKCVCYCYKYSEEKDSVEVTKTEFSKKEEK